MKRSHPWIWFLAVVCLLALLDQGTKLIVRHLVTPVDGDTALVSTDHPVDVCISPTLHTKAADNLAPLAERWGVDVRLLLAGYAVLMTALGTLILGLWLCIIHGLFWELEKPHYPALTTAPLILATAGIICSLWLDNLLWGGSLDWVCITWLVEIGERMVDGHTHPLPYVRFDRLIFDLKDVYLWGACLLLAIRSALVIVTYAKCTPEERAGLREKERHPIRNVKNMLAQMRRSQHQTHL